MDTSSVKVTRLLEYQGIGKFVNKYIKLIGWKRFSSNPFLFKETRCKRIKYLDEQLNNLNPWVL